MSFLDNLEDSLKSLENVSDREGAGREQQQRKTDAAAQVRIAPWAEKLRKSTYTDELMKAATREGFALRMKVYITWIGSVLRLEARERRLELRPEVDGVEAVFLRENEEQHRQLVDFDTDPHELVKAWLKESA